MLLVVGAPAVHVLSAEPLASFEAMSQVPMAELSLRRSMVQLSRTVRECAHLCDSGFRHPRGMVLLSVCFRRENFARSALRSLERSCPCTCRSICAWQLSGEIELRGGHGVWKACAQG